MDRLRQMGHEEKIASEVELIAESVMEDVTKHCTSTKEGVFSSVEAYAQRADERGAASKAGKRREIFDSWTGTNLDDFACLEGLHYGSGLFQKRGVKGDIRNEG